MKKISQFALFLAALGAPLLVAAQSAVPGGINLNVITPYSSGIINFINGILVPILMALAFIYFLFGIYKYFILGASSESDKAEGRKFAMWGIIGFVILLSVWGLVAIVAGTLGLQLGGAAPKPPTI